MIYTTLLQMNTSDTEQNVAHLFEHLAIQGFYDFIDTKGFNSSLVGWINGDAFEDRLFLEGGFYDGRVGMLFEHFMANLPPFTDTAIKKQLASLETEDRVRIAYDSLEVVRSELEKLRRRHWNFDLTTPQTPKEVFTIQKNAAAFRTITIALYTEAQLLSREEQELFLRAYIFLLDTITRTVRRDFTCYPYNSSVVRRDDNYMGFLMHFRFPKRQVTTKELQEVTETLMNNFDIQKAMPQIQKHMEAFAYEPLWKAVTTDYFRETGLTPTPPQIAALATPERFTSLVKKLQVTVFPYEVTFDEQ